MLSIGLQALGMLPELLETNSNSVACPRPTFVGLLLAFLSWGLCLRKGQNVQFFWVVYAVTQKDTLTSKPHLSAAEL